MKQAKAIIVMMAVLSALIVSAGDSSSFRLDTRDDNLAHLNSFTITWDASWIGGRSDATVVISDNGNEIKRTTGVGTFSHTPTGGGVHELTYTTYINGVAQGETYIAQWHNQYTVTFNANGGTGGWSRKLDYGSVIVPPTVTREWYDFAGWQPALPETIPAQDVTYTAQWRRWGYVSASAIEGKKMRELYPSDYAYMMTVVMEEGVTELPEGFFDGCYSITSLTLPSTLVEFGIDDLPLKIWESLAYDEDGFMIYNGWILDYQNRNASAVTIPEGIVGIGRGAFAEMYDLETVTMPESLRSIAKGAFEDCSWIQNLQFMSGLRYVGPVAFRGCSSLMGASFADGVENLGTNVFEACWQMQSVRLPYTVTNIGVKAFTGCGAIRGVTVPTHLKTMQELFPASYSQIETAEVSEGETTVMDDMFAGCVALRGGATQTDMSMIPNTVTNIGARAFQNCTSLTAFVVPDSVVQIGESVFQGCSSLWNVTLSRNLTEIPDYAFYGCSMLETMVVPESVTYLGSRFFSGRTNPIQGSVIENALYYLCTNAPDCHADAYAAIAGNMTTYVVQGSRRWDGRQGSRVLPQEWNGYAITYWTPNRFDVTFDANGGRFDSSGGSTWREQQITDTTYALPSTEPTRPGWAFEGWWTEQTGGAEVRYTTLVTATRTHTVYAHWRSLGERMTVTFNSNGGTVVTPGTQNYVPGQTFGQFPVPTRRGYAFQGWWTEAVNGIRMTEATEVPAADMELFAHWSPITYYVRFHANGGSGTMSDQTFTYDVSGALKNHAFTRTGFAFTGWATTSSGQVRYAENASVVNLAEVQDEVVDLYAVWSGVGYSVRFDSNGGTGTMDNQTIAVGETQNLRSCAFARSGYTFAGWAVSPTDAEAKKVTYLDGAAVKNLATSNGAVVPLYAVWVAGGQTVRITFDANGGSVAPDYWNCEVGTAVEAFPTPTRSGFTFAGWWTAKTGGMQVSSIARVASAQTLYAHWTSNGGVDPGDGSCMVTFNANGGSVTETVRTVEIGTAVGTLPTPTRSGYTFDGWYTATSGGTKITASTKVTGNVTYYAHWVASQGGGAAGAYCVIDLSAGASSSKYPVTYLDAVPAGGWTDEYKTTKLVLRKVDAGSFMMDDVDYDGAEPYVVGSYKVSITKPYYIGVFEVTQRQYELVTGQNPSRYKGDARPVERVSWDSIRGNAKTHNWPKVTTVDANSFVGRLRARSGVTVDLPTLAQGEYAFRAGGGNVTDVSAYGRIPENRNDGKGGYGEHTKVGSYAPNAWGIYDMYGNVSEWTLDWEWYVTKNVSDPVGPNSSADGAKMLGGASWSESYDRDYWYWGGLGTVYSSDTSSDMGFRIAAAVPGAVGPATAKPAIYCDSSYTVVPGQSCSIAITVLSTIKKTTVTVKGLPSGLKYSGGKITGKAKKLGTYKVTITAKNSKGTATKKITIKVQNPGFAVSVTPKKVNGASVDGGAIETSGQTVTVRVGCSQSLSLSVVPGASGVSGSSATVKVTGLPEGLSYKGGAISGVPRKAGTKTVTVKCTNKWGWSKTFKLIIKALALPSSVVGTFNGYTVASGACLGNMNSLDYNSQVVKVTAKSDGKLSAKVGSVAWSASSWTIDEEGFYSAVLKRSPDKGMRLNLRVDPDGAWNSFQMKGEMLRADGVTRQGPNGYLVAQRNPYGKNSKKKYVNAEAGRIATKLTKYGNMKTACILVDVGVYDLAGTICCAFTSFPLAFKVNDSGVATVSGKVGGQKVSGSAVLRVSATTWAKSDFRWRTSDEVVGYDDDGEPEYGEIENEECMQADFCLGSASKPIRIHIEFSPESKACRHGWATIGKHTWDENLNDDEDDDDL